MKALVRMGFRAIRSFNYPQMGLFMQSNRVVYNFAKISKKEQQRSEKKKQKNQAKESLGGNVSEIDLNKYEQAYSSVVSSYKEQLSAIRVGRLDASILSNVQIKIGSESMILSSLAQVSSKSANSCIVSPFDSSHSDLIEKSLKIWDDSLQIKRGQNSLSLTQISQGKQVKDKLILKVKKLANDRKQELKRLRSNTQEQLKKYKKIVPQDRLRIIQSQAKSLFDKKNQQIQKLQKQKQKELLK